MYNVTTYGATGDGVTDDRPSIQAAIDAAKLAGGGVIYFPKGTYLLDSVTNPIGLALVVDSDNIFLEGEGRGVSILRVGDNQNAAPVNFQQMLGGGISKLEIDGNRTNQVGGHGIRSSGGLDGWICRDVYIHDMYSYGIGLQFDATGDATYKNCIIENVIIEDTGLDGIDIKNHDNDNANNKMVNVTVRRAGLRTDVSGQACIDVRGPWQMANISCFEFSDGENTNCQSGIRFRTGETSDSSGVGGHFSTLTNFFVDSGSTNTETFGLHIQAYGVMATGGIVKNTKTGVSVSQRECSISNVFVEGGNNAFLVEDGGGLTNGDRVTLSGCVARGCADSGFKISTDTCNLVGIQARSCANGVNLRTGSINTVISGVALSNSTNLNKQTTGITWTNAGFVT